MDKDKLAEIRDRVEAARPKYKNITAIIGSGHNLCTAVAAECQETGNMDFIADIFPDYVKDSLGNNGHQFCDIGFDVHLARMKFLENVFDDIDYLLGLLDT